MPPFVFQSIICFLWKGLLPVCSHPTAITGQSLFLCQQDLLQNALLKSLWSRRACSEELLPLKKQWPLTLFWNTATYFKLPHQEHRNQTRMAGLLSIQSWRVLVATVPHTGQFEKKPCWIYWDLSAQNCTALHAAMPCTSLIIAHVR